METFYESVVLFILMIVPVTVITLLLACAMELVITRILRK